MGGVYQCLINGFPNVSGQEEYEISPLIKRISLSNIIAHNQLGKSKIVI